MKNLDRVQIDRAAFVQRMNDAIQKNDAEAFNSVFLEMCDTIQNGILEQANALINQADSAVLAQRGVRQLTTTERNYYQKVIKAMRADDPKQAINNLDVVMPETVIDAVFTDLRTEHPLLSKINFRSLAGITKIMMNTNGSEKAAWGKLCAAIVQELTSGFREVDMTQNKLSAFLPVCKAMLDLGPEWMDRYVREVLYEAFANGLEYGFIQGTGKEMPIGMIRDVSSEVSVVSGEYPLKEAVPVTAFDMETLSPIVGEMAVSEAEGKTRAVRGLIMVVNSSDYYSKVLPAIRREVPGGGYVSTLPFAIDVIDSPEVPVNRAVFGMGKRYFAGGSIGQGGRISYSDDYHFLEDERVYLIKGYANGFATDDNDFKLLDISNLKPAYLKVETVAAE